MSIKTVAKATNNETRSEALSTKYKKRKTKAEMMICHLGSIFYFTSFD
jgi:hypothetical protein